MFVSIVDGPPYELEMEEVTDEPGTMISIPVAQDENRVVYVQTVLSPCVIDTFDHHELVFQIAVVSLDESEPDIVTQMREVARPYLADECLPHIMELVKQSSVLLVDTIEPSLIYYVTKESHLPEKALRKYNILTEALQGCGYAIYELGTDAAGRAFWKLTAPTEPLTQ